MAEDMTEKEVTNVGIDSEEVVAYSSLKAGDHLAVTRELLSFSLYTHHGIYIEHDKGAVDFGTTGYIKSSAKPRIVDVLQFIKWNFICGKATLKRVNYDECLKPDVVVENALAAAADPKTWRSNYNLLTNNCEHFATFCKTGKAISKQSQQFRPLFNALKNPKIKFVIKLVNMISGTK